MDWDFLKGLFEAPELSLSPFGWIPLVELLCSRFRCGLAEGTPATSGEVFVAAVELFCLPSFGDLARVVGIYEEKKCKQN